MRAPRPIRTRARFIALAAAFALAAALPSFAAEPAMISQPYLILEDGVLDLRANPQLRQSLGNAVGDYADMEDLVVGSVFIDAGGMARKVVGISEEGGETIIETIVPNVRDVVAEFEMPDQAIEFTEANVVPGSLAEGVTLVTQRGPSRAMLPRGPTWLDTDANLDIQGARVIGVKLDKVLLGAKSDDLPDTDAEGGGKDDGKNGGQAGGDVTVEISGSAELKIEGFMRIAEPTLRGGVKMPSMKIRWVKVWWYFGYPEITFTKGYIHASFTAAEQIDAKLIGRAEASLELKIPLYAITATDPSRTVSGIVGVYLKVTVEGKLEIVFEFNEYTRFNAWGTVDLVWPFIPVDINADADCYYAFAVRPSVSAEVEAKTGPYLGFEIKLLGMSLIELEAGGGIYANISGYIEAMDVIGLDKNVGTFGNWNDWYYDVTSELGGYVEANMTIATLDFNLYEHRWPFLTLINAKGGL